MTHLTVGKRILVGFSSLLLIMTALSVVAYIQLLHIRDRAISTAQDSWPGMYQIATIDRLWSERYALLWEYLTAGGTARQEIAAQIRAKAAQLDKAMQNYAATARDADDRRTTEALQQAAADFALQEAEAIAGSDPAVAGEDLRGRIRRQAQPAFLRVNQAIAAELQYNKADGDRHNQSILHAVRTAFVAIPVALAVGFLLAIITVVLLVRAINRPLSALVSGAEVMRTGNFSQKVQLDRNDEFGALASGLNLMAADLMALISRVQKSGLQVNTSATQIAATAQEQLSTANEIASTTAEIGATSKEISATSKSLAQTMRELSGVAEATAKLAASGQSGLDRMGQTMQKIMDASSSITTRLAVLSEKAGNIGLMVTTITKVADQTNLLSLNAAIEAEKAGDYGRGFSVVATEIRRLADQTAGATNDIEQMVKEIQSAVTAGVMGMDKFSEEVRRGVDAVQQVSSELSQIIEQVQTLTPNFDAVAEGVESQSLGAQQISDALAQLSEASRQTVDSLRQSNMAIEQLNDAARALQSGVTKFVLAA